MVNLSKTRIVFSLEEKRFFLKLLKTPQRNGLPKTIAEISKDYPISAKSLYEWQRTEQHIIVGIAKPRKPSASKSNNYQLQNTIFEISVLNPLYSATDIINHLPKQYQRITVPTVQKILKIKDLNTLTKRLIATEYAYVKNQLPISKLTLEYLYKKNPYLDLLNINSRIDGTIFFVNKFELAKYFKDAHGFILFAVDTKSLTTFSQLWDGKYLDTATKFLNDLSLIFRNKQTRTAHFEANDFLFIDELIKGDLKNITWLNSSQYYFSQDRFEIALKPLLKNIKTFLKAHIYKDDESLKNELENYLLKLRITDGAAGYPTFGLSPYHLNKS